MRIAGTGGELNWSTPGRGEAVSSSPPRWLLRTMWQAHRVLWRVSGGRLGRTSGGHPVLELTTTGRVSGVPRMILIWYITDDGIPIIAGTNAGAPNDPAWIGNLRTDRSARVRVDGVLSEVEAEFLKGSNHDAARARFLDLDPVYGDYAELLSRPVPLVKLSPPAD